MLGWEEDFVVPTQFSERTMATLHSGNMTKSARTEIIQMTVAKMLGHCKYPTLEQYEEVARKIFKHVLKGKGDTLGCGYVSYCMVAISFNSIILYCCVRDLGLKDYKIALKILDASPGVTILA